MDDFLVTLLICEEEFGFPKVDSSLILYLVYFFVVSTFVPMVA